LIKNKKEEAKRGLREREKKKGSKKGGEMKLQLGNKAKNPMSIKFLSPRKRSSCQKKKKKKKVTELCHIDLIIMA
jgi:hypothetical protein